jgi:hypothetical protein
VAVVFHTGMFMTIYHTEIYSGWFLLWAGIYARLVWVDCIRPHIYDSMGDGHPDLDCSED